jgi:hypothetical protein
MNAVKAAAEAGADVPVILIRSSAAATLASVPCDDPVTVSGDVLTLIAAGSDTVGLASGTAASAELRDSDGTIVRSGMSVGLSGSGADVILLSLAVSLDQEIGLDTATIAHG